MEQKQIGYLENTNGEKCDKRLWGSIILTVAILSSLFVIVYDAFCAVELTAATPILGMMYATGGGLLGFTVFEKPKFIGVNKE